MKNIKSSTILILLLILIILVVIFKREGFKEDNKKNINLPFIQNIRKDIRKDIRSFNNLNNFNNFKI